MLVQQLERVSIGRWQCRHRPAVGAVGAPRTPNDRRCGSRAVYEGSDGRRTLAHELGCVVADAIARVVAGVGTDVGAEVGRLLARCLIRRELRGAIEGGDAAREAEGEKGEEGRQEVEAALGSG